MRTITLQQALPEVFAGSENEPPVSASQVWLRSLEFGRPGRWLVVAESGTGKSSLCAYIYGSRTDFRGDILFDGRSVRTLTVEQWCEVRRTQLAYLPQEMHLFPELSVTDNIMLKNRLTDYRTGADIASMLARVELDNKASSPAGRLSVGQQQRVAIVRALCQPFDFLLADEPVSHLDARNNATVAALIADECASRQAGLIATSVGNHLALPDATFLNL